MTRSVATSGADSTSPETFTDQSCLARSHVERHDVAVVGADRDDARTDAGARRKLELGVDAPFRASRGRVERFDLAVATGGEDAARPGRRSPSDRRRFSPPPPTLSVHSRCTGSDGFRSTSSAGGSASFLPSLLQAAIASTARHAARGEADETWL